MNRWLRMLLMADFFMLLAMWMLTPIYAIFVEQIGGDILAASSAWAIFTLVSGILIYLSGKWQDKLRKRGLTHKGFIMSGYLFRSLAFLGYFFVADRLQLFAVQVLLGAGVAMSLPAFDSLYSKSLTKGRYASEWGAWEGMNMIVASVGAVIGGIVASYFGFSTLFLLMFFSSLIGLGISTRLPIQAPGREKGSKT